MLKTDETSGSVLFEEKQKFPGWIKLLITTILLLTIIIVLIDGLKRSSVQRADKWIAFAIAIPVEILVIVLFQNLTLEKTVTSNGLYFRWKSWQKKFRFIEKESIKSFELRNSPPLNYGIHWFPGYGWVHNASAGEGLQLYLKNGKRFFFSTADVDSFKKAMDSLINPDTKTRFSEF